jgi:hypothetical protein
MASNNSISVHIDEPETSTKRPSKRKFGLAWLFSYDEDTDEAAVEAAVKKVVDIDERIRGTWLTLEASKNERRVEATTRQFSRWQPITWPPEDTASTDFEDEGNCTVPIIFSEAAKEQPHVPITEDTRLHMVDE